MSTILQDPGLLRRRAGRPASRSAGRSAGRFAGRCAGLFAGLLPGLLAAVLLPLAGCLMDSADVPPPVIARAPHAAAVPSGAAVTFSVEARGAGPLAYQWQRDGVPIAGARDARYTTAPVSPGDHQAQFQVLVSNPGGVASSAPVLLRVL